MSYNGDMMTHGRNVKIELEFWKQNSQLTFVTFLPFLLLKEPPFNRFHIKAKILRPSINFQQKSSKIFPCQAEGRLPSSDSADLANVAKTFRVSQIFSQTRNNLYTTYFPDHRFKGDNSSSFRC